MAAAGVIGLRLRDAGLVSANDNHGDVMPARSIERPGDPEVVFLFKKGPRDRHRIVGIRGRDDVPHAAPAAQCEVHRGSPFFAVSPAGRRRDAPVTLRQSPAFAG